MPGPVPRDWHRLPDDRLLELRLADLPIRLEHSPVERCFAQLRRELAARHLDAPVTGYLAEEWFTPDGSTAIAVPFYLAHPRLTRLERTQMGDAEGAGRESCLRILRHEAGHVVDNAFDLRRHAARQRLFGRSTTPYPESYVPRPSSRSYVRHIEPCYGQSHPDEDFAETFAVWLTPAAPWRRRYAGTPALRKLDYVDRLMAGLRDVAPTVVRGTHVEPLRASTSTLREYYARKQGKYAAGHPVLSDVTLRRLFPESARAGTLSAGVFLARHRRSLASTLADASGASRFTALLILDDLRRRCAGSGRRLGAPPDVVRAQLVRACARLVQRALRQGTLRVAL